ncbi:MAG: SRPBCC family protein [Mycobacterium sp.]|uniref:SRPBCC family protein n=1 Tax=Mycobacterium sp. TaxID=1785 RepID=UPI003C3736DB
MSTTTTGFVPPLNQIAFSVVDLRLTERWFREGFGLLPAGGSRALMRGPLAAHVQGLPRAASTCWWLVGRNSWFQLELFQFEHPIAKLMPADARPCDIGYTRIGIWVEDFDATLENLARLGSQPLTAPQGERGLRRACVRNPDGVYVEIMEDDPVPQFNKRGRLDCPAAIRSVTLSVPELADAAAYFETGVGLKPSTVILHTPAHEALWGLPGATTHSRVFDGGEVLVEVVHYLDPVGKPWPNNYRISDQGILNIAFGARIKPDFNEVHQRVEAFGAKPNHRPAHAPGAGVVYVNDKHGFSVELMWTKPGLIDRLVGFQPRPVHKRPDPDTRSIQHRLTINGPPSEVWEAITDQDTMAQWIGFNPVTVRKHGCTERHGAGSERVMQGPPGVGQVVEQVIASNPQQSVRYRVIQGSPLANHQGEITLKQVGARTELHWAIRFRPKLPGTGALLQRLLQRQLSSMLEKHLKPRIETRPLVRAKHQSPQR